MNRKYYLAVDLKDDPALIAEYEDWHQRVWPEIITSIKDAGIVDMNIYRTGNRMFMVMEVNDTFNFEQKAKADAANPKVQEWEELMWKYQQPLPGSKPGEKWVLMENVFSLNDFK